MSVRSATLAGRRAAESRMGAANGGSDVTVRRRGGTTVIDGLKVPAYTDVLTGVPFRLGGADRGGSGIRRATVGETEVQLAGRVGSFPAATQGLADGDLVEITAGENTGMFLKIIEATWQDQATARRVPVTEVQRPEGWT